MPTSWRWTDVTEATVAEPAPWGVHPDQADELVIVFFREIESGGPGRLLITDPVKPPVTAIHAGGIGIGVLVAMIAVIPVEDVKAAVGAGLLGNGHVPDVVGRQEIGPGRGEIAGTAAFQRVDVDAAAVDVSHVEPFPELGRVGVRIEPLDPAIGRHLVLVGDDGAQLPGMGRIGAAL